jgi:hypothetical protein
MAELSKDQTEALSEANRSFMLLWSESMTACASLLKLKS